MPNTSIRHFQGKGERLCIETINGRHEFNIFFKLPCFLLVDDRSECSFACVVHKYAHTVCFFLIVTWIQVWSGSIAKAENPTRLIQCLQHNEVLKLFRTRHQLSSALQIQNYSNRTTLRTTLSVMLYVEKEKFIIIESLFQMWPKYCWNMLL